MGAAANGERLAAFPVPPYLPAPARTILPWARRYVAITARRAHVPLTDAWDEAITALVRASVYFSPGAGTFHAYAKTAVVRGLWRYCRRPARLASSELLPARALSTWTAPSAEQLAMVAEVAAEHVAAERAVAAASPTARARATP